MLPLRDALIILYSKFTIGLGTKFILDWYCNIIEFNKDFMLFVMEITLLRLLKKLKIYFTEESFQKKLEYFSFAKKFKIKAFSCKLNLSQDIKFRVLIVLYCIFYYKNYYDLNNTR